VLPVSLRRYRKAQLWKRRCAAIMTPILFIACVAGIFSSGRLALATPDAGSTVNILVRTLFDEMEFEPKVLRCVCSYGHDCPRRPHGLAHTSRAQCRVCEIRNGDVLQRRHPGCAARNYPAGTGFVDRGGGHVHVVRNEGSVDLELVGLKTLPAGAPQRIDALSSGNCAFWKEGPRFASAVFSSFGNLALATASLTISLVAATVPWIAKA
jgi:hypothetical protein